MEDRKRRQFKPNGQTLRIQDRKTYSHKRITRERKQLHILLACLSDLLSNCHGSTTEDWLLRPSTRSWAIPDRQADGVDSLYMDGRNASTAEPLMRSYHPIHPLHLHLHLPIRQLLLEINRNEAELPRYHIAAASPSLDKRSRMTSRI